MRQRGPRLSAPWSETVPMCMFTIIFAATLLPVPFAFFSTCSPFFVKYRFLHGHPRPQSSTFSLTTFESIYSHIPPNSFPLFYLQRFPPHLLLFPSEKARRRWSRCPGTRTPPWGTPSWPPRTLSSASGPPQHIQLIRTHVFVPRLRQMAHVADHSTENALVGVRLRVRI